MQQQASSSSVRDRVTPEEWEQRVALAAAYRLVVNFHWDDLIFTARTLRETAAGAPDRASRPTPWRLRRISD
jgi:hypothetical protein